jgi:tripartite-type tricarboxylate transporter receptor subunit TctC
MYPGVAGSVVGLHKQGVFRILAVLDDKRLPMIPDVPTAAEAGVPGVTLVTFNVVSVPAGTPSAIVDALGKALHKVVNDQTFIDIQFAMGIVTIRDSTPDSAEAFVKQQIELLHPYLQALPKN